MQGKGTRLLILVTMFMIFVILFLSLDFFFLAACITCQMFLVCINVYSDHEETHLDGPTALLNLDARFWLAHWIYRG